MKRFWCPASLLKLPALLLGLIFLTITPSVAQHNHSESFDQRCATDAYEAYLEKNDSKYSLRKEMIQRQVANYIQNKQNGVASDRGVVYRIPVVVHVIWRTNTENISLAQVQSQIDVLNDDFRRLNADTTNTPSQYSSIAADTEIEFCLAGTDPQGNSTDGVTRTQTTTTSFGFNDDMKFTSTGGQDAWPRSDYLNIWVCNMSNTGILGFATPPGGSAALDGVVIDYSYFGTIGTASPPYNKGRTATHEVGHWLSLAHTWGPGNGGCSQDDGITDTPVSTGPNYGCDAGVISCGSRDMVENYMDYSDDACMNIYTQGQADAMRSVLAAGGFRASLANSTACGNAACPTPVNLTATNLQTDQATLSWDAVSGATSYEVQARQVGTATWATGTTPNTTIDFTGLNACTEYEFQVQAICGGSATSTFSGTENFTTTGCSGTCTAPTGLAANTIDDTSAVLAWNTVTSAQQYEVRAREVGTTTWTTGVTAQTGINYTGLNACTEYEFQVSSICASGNSAFSPLFTFTTTGCSNLCESYGQSTEDEWIESIVIGPLSNTSGDDGGYGDYTMMGGTLMAGNTYNVSLTPGYAAQAYNEGWRIWIDYNQSGVFDANELAFDPGTLSTTTVTGSFTVPQNIVNGPAAMRVQMKYNGMPDPCEIFDYGEVEDYVMTLTGGNAASLEDELPNLQELVSYPNPFSETLTISLTWDDRTDYSIRVLDLMGKELHSETASANAGSKAHQLNLGHLADGVYLISIETEEAREVIRVVKQ